MVPATFQEAFAAARNSYSTNQWEALRPTERVTAIYHEMRRIDAERARNNVTARASGSTRLSRDQDRKNPRWEAGLDPVRRPRSR